MAVFAHSDACKPWLYCCVIVHKLQQHLCVRYLSFGRLHRAARQCSSLSTGSNCRRSCASRPSPQVDTSRCIVEGSTEVLSFAFLELKLQPGALAGVLRIALFQYGAKLPACMVWPLSRQPTLRWSPDSITGQQWLPKEVVSSSARKVNPC